MDEVSVMTASGDYQHRSFSMQNLLPCRVVRFPMMAALLTFSLLPLTVSSAQTVTDPTFSRPLDNWPGAVAAYSFRKVRTAYTGAAVQLRRASDGAKSDIGFTAAGNFDAASAAMICASSKCAIAIWYDQSGNGNDLVQPDIAQQWQYIGSGARNGLPVARCATPPCGMKAPDSPTLRPTNVETFMVVKFSTENSSFHGANRWGIGFPLTNADTLSVYPPSPVTWFFGEMFLNTIMQAAGTKWGSNLEGFGAVYRNQLFQYDADSQTGTVKYNTTQWQHIGIPNFFGTLTYPTPMGLYVGNGPDGKSSVQGDFAEILLYDATQSARDSISTNQSSYWAIIDPPTTVISADGFTWSPIYTENFGPASSGGPNAGIPFTIRSKNYFAEGSWDSYSIWRATNVPNGADMTRFELHPGNMWSDGSERAEFDGAASPLWPSDKTIQISYAVKIEPGTIITNAAWNALGQFHYGSKGTAAATFSVQLLGDKWSVDADHRGRVYTSPTITRDQWYDFFVEQRISSNGNGDVLNIWINGTQVVNDSGTLFPHSGGGGGYWKFGIYRGWGGVIPPMAARYANMEVVDKSLTDISSRITSPLPHPG
jgi:Alpha-L-arabinofuranosidase B, catalytic/Polysaccharide lyase